MSAWVGEDPFGDWLFHISDNVGGETGSLDIVGISYNFDPPTAIEPGSEQMPNSHILESAYPNPFNPSASIGFTVAQRQEVIMGLYDALGRRVKDLFVGTVAASTRTVVEIEAENLPSGLYVVRLVGEAFTATRSVTILK